MVLICISLIINDAEHLFMCLVTICISSLEICLFEPFASLWIGFFVCFWVLYMMDVNHLLDNVICKYFFPSYWLPSYYVDIVLWSIKVLFWCTYYLFFVACIFGVESKKSLLNSVSWIFPVFPFKGFIVLCLWCSLLSILSYFLYMIKDKGPT